MFKVQQCNSFVDDLGLIEESQEYDSDLDSESKKCMECPEVFMDWTDISDHMRKVHKFRRIINASHLWSQAWIACMARREGTVCESKFNFHTGCPQ